jgi:hypothetical protein
VSSRTDRRADPGSATSGDHCFVFYYFVFAGGGAWSLDALWRRACRHVGQAHRAVEQLRRQLLAPGDADAAGKRSPARRSPSGVVAAADAFTTAENQATEQAAQIQNMILQGYDAIVLNAASPTP